MQPTIRMLVLCTHRVEYKKDTKLMNAGTFIFQREDHTIGNILRMYATGWMCCYRTTITSHPVYNINHTGSS